MNKTTTISKWFSMLLLMLVAGVGSAFAQSLAIDDFSIKAGETKEVAINLVATDPIYGIQTDIVLSEGLTLTEITSTFAEPSTNELASATRVILLKTSGTQADRAIPAGEVLKLKVTAATGFETGTISLTNTRLTTSIAGTEQQVDNVTANVTKDDEEPFDGVVWDFTTTIATPAQFLDDETHWLGANENARFTYQLATDNGALMLGEEELADTKGLLFTGGTGKFRIDINQRLGMNGKNLVLTIPNLKKGQKVIIEAQSANSSEARRFTVTNLTYDAETMFLTTTELQVNEGEVTADGDVSFTTSAGMNIFKIAVQNLQGEEPITPDAPAFSPEGGEFDAAQTVTLSCATEGASIYYTIDGTTPTAESELYSEAITVSETTTIKAIAILGEKASDVAEATYTINASVEPGDEEIISMSDIVFYNWDGVGADAIQVSIAEVDNHIGQELTGGNTVVGTSTVYYLTYADLTGCTKMLVEGTPGMLLRVLLNRPEPVEGGDSNGGPVIEKQITLDENGKAELDLTEFDFVHLNSIKINYGGPDGTITAINLVKPLDPLAVPKEALKNAIAAAKLQSPVAKTEDSFATLTQAISDAQAALADANATETSLTEAKTAIEQAIAGLTLAEGYTVLTKDMYKHWDDNYNPTVGEAVGCAYEIGKSTGQPYGDGNVQYLNFADISQYDKLILTVAAGTPRIMMNRLEVGNGGGDSNGGSYVQLINDPVDGVVEVDLTQYDYAHLNAIKSSAWGQEVTVTGIYLYKGQAATVDAPAFSPEGGEFDAAQTVTLSCATEGASIYYTIDGTTPTAESELYSNAITVSETTTIKAIAILGEDASEVAQATFTIVEPEYFVDFPAGDYYVIDVETGKFMAAGHDWGTRAIVDERGLDLTLTPDQTTRTVTFDSRVRNKTDEQFLSPTGGTLYMDQPAFGWSLLYQGFGFYITDRNGQYISIDENDNLIMSEIPHEWIIVTAEGIMESRLADLEEATEENPVDATFLIKANGFNRNDLRNAEAWEIQQTLTGQGHTTNISGGNNINNCAEAYHTGLFSFSQVISGAPAGVYKLTAQGFYRQDEEVTEDAPLFFANDATAEIPVKGGTENNMSDASESFTNGLYTIEPIEFIVENDGTMTIGAQGTGEYQWVIFDNFQLTYYGPANNEIIEEEEGDIEVEIGKEGYITYGSLRKGFSIPNGLTAYAVKVSGNGKGVILTEVTEVAVCEAVVLKGQPGTYTLPVIDKAEKNECNELLPSDGNLQGNNSTIFAMKIDNENGIGFYKVDLYVPVPAHRGYLVYSNPAGREFLGFLEDPTGISAILNGNGQINEKVYNLNGQRVAIPSKGLYILNGKKVLVK